MGNLSDKVLAYIQERAQTKLEKLDKDISKVVASDKSIDPKKLEVLNDRLIVEQEKYEPKNWLTDAAKRASQIQFVTHVLKYNHGDAKGSSVFLTSEYSQNKEGHICSANLQQADLDIVGNAAALDVGKLLMLKHKDKTLLDHVLNNDLSPFLPIAKDREQAESWLVGFKQVLEQKELSSHKLAKQVYWPLNRDKQATDSEPEYHLLSPLFASSFAHKIYSTRRDQREVQFSKDEAVKAQGHSFMPNLAVQTFGGTKPQNISQLNSQRGGKNYLLDSRPPEWNSVPTPPYHAESVFISAFPRLAYNAVKTAHGLRAYLEKVHHQASRVEIRQAREKGIDRILDMLLLFAASLNTLPAGWTDHPDCKLSIDEQIWLDPGRAQADAEFRYEMEKKDWHDKVAGKFATWLNNRLRSKSLNPGEAEYVEWKMLVAQELRLTERARKEFY